MSFYCGLKIRFSRFAPNSSYNIVITFAERKMLTTLRKVGNSRGVLIPAAMLAECQIQGPVEMTVEAGRLVITPVCNPRSAWFAGYDAAADEDVWGDWPVEEGCTEWVW
jgi:antitoxin MazE